MTIDAGIAAGADQRNLGDGRRFVTHSLVGWILSIGSESKIRHKNYIALSASAQQKILRFNVAMKVACRMKIFDSMEKLIHQHQCGLEGESVVAILEEILQTGAKEFKDHCSVITIRPVPEHSRNTRSSIETLVYLNFLAQEWWCNRAVLEFDSYLLAVGYIAACPAY